MFQYNCVCLRTKRSSGKVMGNMATRNSVDDYWQVMLFTSVSKTCATLLKEVGNLPEVLILVRMHGSNFSSVRRSPTMRPCPDSSIPAVVHRMLAVRT